eukprot:TRINITY_DN35393_c0_g1_i1.p1 TRINITY_DN35393_c0_g1~~TRINITY_DN35393_c0_g1_i1.p1  ORF type:complete len:281 (+),score=42.76 TRINITY_DN35393_c0_g1_i1:162-1004(+)
MPGKSPLRAAQIRSLIPALRGRLGGSPSVSPQGLCRLLERGIDSDSGGQSQLLGGRHMGSNHWRRGGLSTENYCIAEDAAIGKGIVPWGSRQLDTSKEGGAQIWKLREMRTLNTSSSLSDEVRQRKRLVETRALFLSSEGRWAALRGASFSTSTSSSEEKKETIHVTFVDKYGKEKGIQVPVGQSMLEAAHENDIDLEGACEGSLACSTCHVIVMDEAVYDKLPEPCDEENDMLDLAFGLTSTSRLGCQVIAKKELDGMKLALPPATRNFAVDGYKPKPH